MTTRTLLHHHTDYRFDRRVALSTHLVRLHPASHTVARVHDYRLVVEPPDHVLRWQSDLYGNRVGNLSVHGRTDHLVLDVQIEVDLALAARFESTPDEGAPRWPSSSSVDHLPALTSYLSATATGAAFETFAAGHRLSTAPSASTVDRLASTCRAVRDAVTYTPRADPGVLTPEATLTGGVGSCRDSAWLLVQVLRRSGVAARFASGYLVQLAGDPEQGPGRATAGPVPTTPTIDQVDLHAWCEAFLPGTGWIGLDTTSGLITGAHHIPLAVAPDPTETAPVSGTTDPCHVTLTVSHRVERLGPTTRL